MAIVDCFSSSREAGAEVLEVFCSFDAVVERASIDEAFIDLTSLVSNKRTSVPVEELGDAFIEGFEDTTTFLERETPSNGSSAGNDS